MPAPIDAGGKKHDKYGKRVLRAATRLLNDASQPHLQAVFRIPPRFPFSAGGGCDLDGIFKLDTGLSIVVEVESRVPKQVRGAVLDLLRYPAPMKLLALLPTRYIGNVHLLAAQCGEILAEHLEPRLFQMVALSGTGDDDRCGADAPVVARAVRLLMDVSQ